MAALSVYGAAVSALSAGGDWSGCLELLDRMDARGVSPDLGAYECALHACQASGEWQAVRDLLYRMRAEGVTNPGTLGVYHITLWKRAAKELGLATLGAKDKKKRAPRGG